MTKVTVMLIKNWLCSDLSLRLGLWANFSIWPLFIVMSTPLWSEERSAAIDYEARKSSVQYEIDVATGFYSKVAPKYPEKVNHVTCMVTSVEINQALFKSDSISEPTSRVTLKVVNSDTFIFAKSQIIEVTFIHGRSGGVFVKDSEVVLLFDFADGAFWGVDQSAGSH